MSEKINLFVSHYGGDEGYISKFKDLLSEKGYEIRDSSIVESQPNNATNEEYIKSFIRSAIDWAGKVVVLIGPKTAERDWVTWEIEHANRVGDKNIIGVFLPGATDADVPEALNKYGTALVVWNFDKIVEAIEGNPIWQDSTGKQRTFEGHPRETC